MGRYRIITCAGCCKQGYHNARNLCRPCYGRHQYCGTLDRFPPAGFPHKDRNPWRPRQARALGLVEDYVFLISQGVTKHADLAERLGISARHVERVAGAHRTMIKEGSQQ